jgi:Tfp pilus assembly protein FimT
MGHERGFSLVELLIGLGCIGTLAAVSVPLTGSAMQQSKINTAQHTIAAQLRQARLAAVTRRATTRVAFDCPAPGAIRVLALTGDTSIDDAGDRCDTMNENDSGAVWLPEGVVIDSGTGFDFDAAGEALPLSGSAPATVIVALGGITRSVTVSGAGRILVVQP